MTEPRRERAVAHGAWPRHSVGMGAQDGNLPPRAPREGEPGAGPLPSSPAGGPTVDPLQRASAFRRAERLKATRRILVIMGVLFGLVALGPMVLWSMVVTRAGRDRAPWVEYLAYNGEYDCCYSSREPRCRAPVAGVLALERRLAERGDGTWLDGVRHAAEGALGATLFDGNGPTLQRVREEIRDCPGFQPAR